MSKQKLIVHKRIASAGYEVTDETVNQIINECSKLAQKECKSRHDRGGKVILRELCNRNLTMISNRTCIRKRDAYNSLSL